MEQDVLNLRQPLACLLLIVSSTNSLQFGSRTREMRPKVTRQRDNERGQLAKSSATHYPIDRLVALLHYGLRRP